MRRNDLVYVLHTLEPSATVVAVDAAEKVLAGKTYDFFDVAFLDIELPGMNGLELARRLQAANPHINLVFTTAHSEFMADALAIHCSGYLMKPITAEKVRNELECLRWPVVSVNEDVAEGLFVRCFGSFEAFYDNTPLSFKHQRTKELLAYLVAQRGAMSTVNEIEAVLWETLPYTSSHQSYLRHMVSDLRKTLDDVGAPNVLVKRRGMLGIAPATFACDYYNYLDGKPGSAPAVRKFMSQYSWAEGIQAEIFSRELSAVHSQRW